jgi:uncharacterized protein (DUF433 family)/DNA-binding transcriptional MerR regulator
VNKILPMEANSVRQMPPRGHYLAGEVGALAGVSGNRVGQWARNGYINSSQSDGPPRVYSYQDVAEAMVVHELVERDIPYREIRDHIEDLRMRFGIDWPLTQAPVGHATAGKQILTKEGGQFYRHGYHQALDVGDLRDILGLLNRGGWVVRNLTDLKHIEVNPNRLSGRPVIRGTRVPVRTVAQVAARPDGIKTLHEGFDLSDEEIFDPKRWWEATQEFERKAA